MVLTRYLDHFVRQQTFMRKDVGGVAEMPQQHHHAATSTRGQDPDPNVMLEVRTESQTQRTNSGEATCLDLAERRSSLSMMTGCSQLHQQQGFPIWTGRTVQPSGGKQKRVAQRHASWRDKKAATTAGDSGRASDNFQEQAPGPQQQQQ
jgi:hypothetical protein